MSELTALRWKKGDGHPSSHPVHEALEVAMHRIRSGEWKADHVIVIVAEVDENGGVIPSFAQAGQLNLCGQVGLVELAKTLIAQ